MTSKSQFILRNLARRLSSSVILITLTVLMGTSDAWAKGNALAAGALPAQVTEETENQPASGQGAAASSSPAGSALPLGDAYAAREASSKSLESFTGGDVVIIGSGGLILILLIILIIVLI